jgi:DNA-damage-inducible protein J
MTAKAAMIRARTDGALKDQVEKIFEKLGLNTTSAINLFYRQVALNQGLPFEVRLPNAATRKAMRDAQSGKTQKGFKNVGALFSSLND